MNFMLNKVVEEGTGKRAMLDGIRAAGKTGTTNAYRDAWFVGYHRQPRRRRLVRQRRPHVHEQHDRRHAARHDLEGGHGASRTRTSSCARSPASRPNRDRRSHSPRRIMLPRQRTVPPPPFRRRHPARCRGAPSRRSRTSAHSSARPTQPASSPRRRPTAAPRRDKPGSSPTRAAHPFDVIPGPRSGARNP